MASLFPNGIKQTIYVGLSYMFSDESAPTVAIAIRDTTYLLDFMQHSFSPEDSFNGASNVVEFILTTLKEFGGKHMEKILGVAMSESMADNFTTLCPRLWAELDIVPLVLPDESTVNSKEYRTDSPEYPAVSAKTLDEQAESMGRKVVRYVWMPFFFSIAC